ncbi:MAG: NAD(P)-dependent oxidoreductase [Pseudomonadota bacterium]
MAKTIVTGASGFIGYQIAQASVGSGNEVVGYTSRPGADLPEGVVERVVDLTNDATVRTALQADSPEILIHSAWQSVIAGLWGAPQNLDWVKHSLSLAEAFADIGGRRFVGIGSCGEYDWASGLCSEETTFLKPSTFYGACKHSLETLLSGFFDLKNLEFAWLRPFFVYGPRENTSRLGASVVSSILKGEPALCSHGMQLRDYLHVTDVGEGVAAFANSDLTGAFNIGSGTAIRVKDLIAALAEAAGDPGLVRLGARDAPAFEPPLIVADMSKAHAALEWRPRFSLQSGAKDTVRRFRS